MSYYGPRPTSVPITTTDLADGIVSTAKIAALAVDGTRLATGAVSANTKLAAGVVDANAIGAGAVSGQELILPLFQCQFVYTSTTVCTLNRKNGSWLFINGQHAQIPVTAPTLGTGSLSPSTLYYVYAYMNAGVMTLEASATAYATDATYGHKIKSGDATRSLVGLVRTNGSTQFVDSQAQKFVCSYYHAPSRRVVGSTATATTTSSTYVELDSATRGEFILFAQDILTGIIGSAQTGTTTDNFALTVGVDGATTTPGVDPLAGADAAATRAHAFTPTWSFALSDGYHYVTPIGKTTGGTLSPSVAVWAFIS